MPFSSSLGGIAPPWRAKDERSGTHRQRWTPSEDQALIVLVKHLGARNWRKIASSIPGRTSRQCRDRFANYLSPNLTKEPWSPEEDRILLERFEETGPHWFQLSPFLPGRSGHAIKNRWYSHLHGMNSLWPADTPEPSQSSAPAKSPIVIRIEGDPRVAPVKPQSPALAMLLNP
jgi:hypothetical protein